MKGLTVNERFQVHGFRQARVQSTWRCKKIGRAAEHVTAEHERVTDKVRGQRNRVAKASRSDIRSGISSQPKYSVSTIAGPLRNTLKPYLFQPKRVLQATLIGTAQHLRGIESAN